MKRPTPSAGAIRPVACPRDGAGRFGRCCRRGGQPRHADEARCRRSKRRSTPRIRRRWRRSPMARRKPPASRSGRRPPPRFWRSRAEDAPAAAESYRPHASAGVYVPTAVPAAPQWPQRKPWLMTTAAQFRPAPPPALTSEAWARDYNEIKAFGGKTSTRRSAEQTEIARFWEFSLPLDLSRRRALGGQHAGTRRDAERAPVRGGGAGRWTTR